jgi:hypothetical protein
MISAGHVENMVLGEKMLDLHGSRVVWRDDPAPGRVENPTTETGPNPGKESKVEKIKQVPVRRF